MADALAGAICAFLFAVIIFVALDARNRRRHEALVAKIGELIDHVDNVGEETEPGVDLPPVLALRSPPAPLPPSLPRPPRLPSIPAEARPTLLDAEPGARADSPTLPSPRDVRVPVLPPAPSTASVEHRGAP